MNWGKKKFRKTGTGGEAKRRGGPRTSHFQEGEKGGMVLPFGIQTRPQGGKWGLSLANKNKVKAHDSLEEKPPL